MHQAGVGTSGGSIGFGVKENNFLGNGISLDSNFSLSTEIPFKGNLVLQIQIIIILINLCFFLLKLIENDNYKTFGYKTNKTGINIGTNFEYLNDLYLGINNSNFYEVIETNSTASAQQQAKKVIIGILL